MNDSTSELEIEPAASTKIEPSASGLSRFGRFVARAIRDTLLIAIGIALCARQWTSVIVVGWTFRMMRRSIYRGWWKRSPVRSAVRFEDLDSTAASSEFPRSPTPRWIVAENYHGIINRPRPDGGVASRLRKLVRLPAALTGGLRANLRSAARALACTYLVTFPGCFLWLAAWYDGWNNSFNKGYEQAAVGPLTGILGNVMFMSAMMYLPMAWSHVAATGDARAFFQFGYIVRLARTRLGGSIVYAAIFAIVSFPVMIFRALPTFLTQSERMESASPELINRTIQIYAFSTAIYVFFAYIITHRLAARLYRSATTRLLAKEPDLVDRLHPVIYKVLEELALLPSGAPPRGRPIVEAVIKTGRRGKNAVLWTAAFVVWFAVVAQIFIGQFFNYQPVTGWLNQPLVHLPSLYFSASR